MTSRPATEAQKFSSDIAWVALSQVLTLLISIFILPALTKSYSTAIYGVWVQINVSVGIISSILTLYLAAALVRFLPREKGKEEKRRAFGAILWPVIAFACSVFLASLLLKQNLSTLIFGSAEYASFVPLVFLLASIDAFAAFCFAFFQATSRIKTLSIIQLVSFAFQMIMIVALAVKGYSLLGIIISVIIVRASFGLLTFGMIVKEIGWPRPNIDKLGHYLAYGLPLVPTGLLFFALSSSDRYFITHLVSLSQTGIYSASYTLGNTVSFFITPIIFVLFPTLARLWEQGELPRARNYIEYSTKLFLAIAIPGAAGLYILSQPVLTGLATQEYAAGGSLMLLIALGTIFYGIYLLNVGVIQLIEQTKWLPIIMGVAAAVNISANLALLPRIGIIGAGLSMVISYFLLASIVMVWARKAIGYKMDIRFLVKVVLSTALMVFCLSFIKINNAVTILLTACAGVIVYAGGLFLLRAFSMKDRKLARELVVGLIPQSLRNRPGANKVNQDDMER